MKILFLTDKKTYGGASKQFYKLAEIMGRKGHDVHIHAYVENNISNSVNSQLVHQINTNRIFNNWLYRNTIYRISEIFKISRHISANGYDLIISFNDMVNIALLLSYNPHKSKIVISERSDPYHNKKYLQIIKKFFYRKANGVVFQTKGAQQFFGKKIINKSMIIKNPAPQIPREIFDRQKDIKDKRIVSVARFWLYQKRQDVLIEAYRKIIETHSDYKLVLYGDGPDKRKIQDLIVDSGIESYVEMVGVSHNIIEEIKNASLFVLSSDFEGLPNALIEAMTLGLPVVSTDCSPGGARELINNGINGILVPCSDSHRLAEAINYMLDNPNKAREMGNEAKKIGLLLNSEKIYNEWDSYLNEI